MYATCLTTLLFQPQIQIVCLRPLPLPSCPLRPDARWDETLNRRAFSECVCVCLYERTPYEMKNSYRSNSIYHRNRFLRIRPYATAYSRMSLIKFRRLMSATRRMWNWNMNIMHSFVLYTRQNKIFNSFSFNSFARTFSRISDRTQPILSRACEQVDKWLNDECWYEIEAFAHNSQWNINGTMSKCRAGRYQR